MIPNRRHEVAPIDALRQGLHRAADRLADELVLYISARRRWREIRALAGSMEAAE